MLSPLYYLYYMGCCEDCLTCDICLQCDYVSKSWLDTCELQSHRGCYKLVLEPSPTLGAPLLGHFQHPSCVQKKCFESFRNYISESLGILFTSQSPHRSGKASRRRVLSLLFSNFTKFFQDHAGILESFRWFYDENIVLVPPVRGLVEVSRGVEL